MRTDDVLLSVAAAGLGAVLAALLVGASLVFAVPVALAVGAVSLVSAGRNPR